ncbi:MAG TPA: RNA methyltransferase [Streptosporangiaceae bacterium]|nr:RNA methyltransferase [Streptosporangiaceae bacterium]
MAEVITSAANPLVKRVRLLADRKHRRREGAFVVQGIQPVWQAVEAGADVEVLIVAPGLLRHPGARDLVSAQEAAGVRVARLSDDLFARLGDRDGPSGLAAIVRSASRPLASLRPGPDAVIAVLHQVANPGNLGTIIRTASAAGIAGVVLIGPSADPYDPAAVKASMGALFTVPVAAASAAEFLQWATAGDVRVVATSGRASVSCWEADLRPPLALLFGSEGAGLPGDLLKAADARVAIPMTGTAESLNLAVAAGILLFEVRRRTGLPPPG